MLVGVLVGWCCFVALAVCHGVVGVYLGGVLPPLQVKSLGIRFKVRRHGYNRGSLFA